MPLLPAPIESCLTLAVEEIAKEPCCVQEAPNPSIERTATSRLRRLASAAHVER